jgi:hypothetical protein
VTPPQPMSESALVQATTVRKSFLLLTKRIVPSPKAKLRF